MKDFYYILGTNEDCTLDEIKEAYRKLSKKFHPDLNPGDEYFENRFREIKEAYDTLADPVKRSEYDKLLNKFKADAPGGQFTEQPQYRPYQSRYAAFRKSKKGPGIGMTIILIVLGCITAIYVVKSFSNSRARKAKVTETVSITPYKTHRHHKKKHSLKNKIDSDSAGYHTSNAITTASKPMSVSDKQVALVKQPASASNKPPVQAPDKQLVSPDNSKSMKSPVKSVQSNTNKPVDYNGNYLYATNVRANVTGVINLRKSDTYNSEVIKTIPANSKVFVMEKGDKYYRVFFDNTIGFVPKWSLETK